jgi:hypothetical protein
VPAIVNNDFPGQNMPDTLGLTVFLSTPYETAVPIRLIPDAQRETKDTPLDSLVNEYYRWWRPKGDKGRDLEKELAESR